MSLSFILLYVVPAITILIYLLLEILDKNSELTVGDVLLGIIICLFPGVNIIIAVTLLGYITRPYFILICRIPLRRKK